MATHSAPVCLRVLVDAVRALYPLVRLMPPQAASRRLFARRAQLIANFERSARDGMRGQFQHATRLSVRQCRAEGAQIFNQLDDAQLPVKKDHVNREKHPERMYAIAGTQPEGFRGGQT